MLRTSAAAKYLGVDVKTFRKWVRAGLVPFMHDPETSTRWFSKESLDSWLNSFGAEQAS